MKERLVRWAIALSVAYLLSILAYIFNNPHDSKGAELAAAPALVVIVFISWEYAIRLAERDHLEHPDKYKEYKGGNSNGPIYSAMFRAAQNGDRKAKWAMACVFGGPFIFAFFMFLPVVIRKFA